MRLDYNMIIKIMPLPIKKLADKPVTTKRGRRLVQISEVTVKRVLSYLPTDSEVTSDWIAKAAKLHPGTVSRALTALIKTNKVKRTKRNKVNYISIIGNKNAQ
ncbi:MAG: hypothetical protein Unbinned1520contig1002_23 [Prokaryotic dsDNA virus sp.]|nr:MAG: hypothetical protein Unbinned1520contig1002_23 [Prokaryotic dsDNA virus sp.]|tara:strand:- start:1689 stop:1997 length:309 start_codon:yes stop_codon:yes gene_type:complete